MEIEKEHSLVCSVGSGFLSKVDGFRVVDHPASKGNRHERRSPLWWLMAIKKSNAGSHKTTIIS
jgi:hypothetical protein